MKKSFSSIKDKVLLRNTFEDLNNSKSTNINVLLNRVRLDKKKESLKKVLFTAAASAGLLLFGVLIF